MRELSDQERKFLKENLPKDFKQEQSVSDSAPVSSFLLKIKNVTLSILRYLPLTIGLITIFSGFLLTYLYFWSLSVLRINDLKELNLDDLAIFMDGTTEKWVEQIVAVTRFAPWLIFAVFLLGLMLVAVTIFINRRKNVE